MRRGLGLGSIRKRKAGGYQIRYAVNGQRVEESVAESIGKPPTCVTKGDARELLKRRIAEAHAGLAPQKGGITVADVLDGALAHARQQKRRGVTTMIAHAKPVRRALGDVRVDHLDVERLNAYIAARLASQAMTGGRSRTATTRLVSGGTVGRELAILRGALTLAQRQGRIRMAPHVPGLPRPEAREAYIPVDAFDRILAHMPGQRWGDDHALYREMAEYTYQTGCRYSEVVGLRWEYVDTRAATVRLPGAVTKNGRPRGIPVEGRIAAILESRRGKRRLDCPWVFHRAGKRITAAFREAWRVACAAAGLPGLRPHDCRRTAVRDLRLAGVHPIVRKALVGHESDQVHAAYDSVSDAEQRAAIRAREAMQEQARRESNVIKIGRGNR